MDYVESSVMKAIATATDRIAQQQQQQLQLQEQEIEPIISNDICTNETAAILTKKVTFAESFDIVGTSKAEVVTS